MPDLASEKQNRHESDHGHTPRKPLDVKAPGRVNEQDGKAEHIGSNPLRSRHRLFPNK
jgi:hypothetical protein